MVYMTTRDLAERWHCSTRKIEQQRMSGIGPAYLKIGKQVLYDISEIKAFEADNTFSSTTDHDVRAADHSDKGEIDAPE